MSPENQPQGQYDFIMSGNHPSKKPGFTLPDTNSRGKRVAIVAGLGVIVLIFLFVMMSLLSSGGDSKENFLKLVQQQTEISRIAGLASAEPAASQNTQNTATTTQLALSSDKQSLIKALTTVDITFGDKELAPVPNQATDKQLADAKAAANYDTVLISILSQQLINYQSTLQQTYEKTQTKAVKDTLAKEYESSKLLRTQVEATKP